ncbi:MAG TPA: DNA gyrase inhibitor YacG [Solimonas sp.]|nr:DNA gyrase inhibitor YacG [Solimonas sp.]
MLRAVSGAPAVRPRIAACPQCGDSTRLDTGNPHRPFCSERCRLVDLGAWFSGQYGVAADDQTPDVDPSQRQ